MLTYQKQIDTVSTPPSALLTDADLIGMQSVFNTTVNPMDTDLEILGQTPQMVRIELLHFLYFAKKYIMF